MIPPEISSQLMRFLITLCWCRRRKPVRTTHALALITAVDKGTISTATWAGHGYNYMQFRTSSGGVEVGSAIVDAQGNVSVTGYWPYGSIGQGTGAFNIG